MGNSFFWSHGSEKSTFFRILTFLWLSALISHFFDRNGHIFTYFEKHVYEKIFFLKQSDFGRNLSAESIFFVPWLYKNQFFQNLNFSERCQKETFLRNIDGLKFSRKIFFRRNTVVLM